MTSIASLTVAAQQICPACDYSLAGLPDDHRCPECGFAYSHDMIVWRGTGRAWLWSIVSNGITVGVGAFLWYRSPISAVLILMGLIGAILGGWRMRRARRRLIIGSREIRLLDRHGPEQAWPLAPVARAERSILNGRLLLIGHSSEILAKLPGDLIGSNRRTKMLVSAINERLERHQLNTPD